MISVSSTAMPIFTRTGMLGLPRIGALAINARIRNKGHKNAAMAVFRSASVILIIYFTKNYRFQVIFLSVWNTVAFKLQTP
jgi:hypothetical protein